MQAIKDYIILFFVTLFMATFAFNNESLISIFGFMAFIACVRLLLSQRHV